VDSLLGLCLLHLGNHDGQNAVLHACLDFVVVNRIGEGEAAGKFTHATFGDPVCVLWVVFGDVLGSGGGHFGAGGSLTGFVFAIGVDFGGGGFGAFLSDAFGPALDGDGLFVSELNDDVLLVNAGKFAFEDVVVFGFLHVKLGRKCARGAVGQLLEFREGIVEEIEEWTHLLAVGTKGTWEAWEESHVSCLNMSWL